MIKPNFDQIIKIVLLSVGIALIFAIPISSQTTEQSQSLLSMNTPFGGRVLFTMSCSCNTNGDSARQKTLVMVGSPSNAMFIKDMTTRVYQKNSVSMSNWVLGLAGQSEGCSQQVGYYCTQIGQGKLIKMVGTSGFGF